MAASGRRAKPSASDQPSGSGTAPMNPAVDAVSFVAPSGTGKTTLIAAVIEGLTARGVRVGAVKHDAHRIELDAEGKDSWRLREAGAVETVLAGANQMAWMSSGSGVPTLADLLVLMSDQVDLVLVEGFRSAGLASIVVERPEVPKKNWQPPPPDLILATVHPSDAATVIELLTETYGLGGV